MKYFINREDILDRSEVIPDTFRVKFVMTGKVLPGGDDEKVSPGWLRPGDAIILRSLEHSSIFQSEIPLVVKEVHYGEWIEVKRPSHIGPEFRGNWDWNKMIPSWVHTKLVLDGLPGWELTDDGRQREHMCHFVMGHKAQSRDVAIDVDDWCIGMFYYNDKTGGTPFVGDGDEYVSFYSFQLKRDWLEFGERYGKSGGPCSPTALRRAASFGRKVYGWSEEDIARYTKQTKEKE